MIGATLSRHMWKWEAQFVSRGIADVETMLCAVTRVQMSTMAFYDSCKLMLIMAGPSFLSRNGLLEYRGELY